MAIQMIPCPACKKKISGEAQACPHCGQPIDEKYREKELREIKAGKMGCLILLVLVVGLIILISVFSEDKQTQEAQKATPLATHNSQATSAESHGQSTPQHQPSLKDLPSVVQGNGDDIDIVYNSDKRIETEEQQGPEKTESQELNEFEANAKKGDYQAQRNTAWMYSTSKDPFVSNKLLGCAWYKLILLSGSPRVGPGDIGNVKTYCGKLSPEEQMVTEQQAKRLYHEIYEEKPRKKSRGKP